MSNNYKIFDTLPCQAKDIRTKVFVQEQGFKNEFDSVDEYAKHIVIFDENGIGIATGRVFTDDGENYHIGRVAVVKSHRGEGLGLEIMEIAEAVAKEENAKSLIISAQLQAKHFYEKCGFFPIGEFYYDEHCEHIEMIKAI